MKKIFYHIKGNLNATYSYETNDTLKQIKSDMSHNACVLDAIYNEETQEVKLYTYRFATYEILANL